MIYNDHGLNFFLDKMPTFAVGAAPEYRNADEGWGIPTVPPFQGDPDLSLAPDRVAGRRRVRPHHLPGDAGRPRASRCRWRCCGRAAASGRCASCRCASTPCSPRCRRRARCYKLGQADRPRDRRPGTATQRVVVIGTGGLSHQLDGERAGFINKDVRPEVHGQPGQRPDLGDAVLDRRPGRADRHAGRRAADVAGHARRAAGERVRKVHAQLPHPDLEHRGRD